MPPIEKSRRHHAQELRLQTTLCSNARSGKKMPERLQTSPQHQKFCQWCRDDEIVPTQSILFVHGVPIRLCQSAAPIGIKYCFSVTLQSDLVLIAIAVVIAILVLAIRATLMALQSWTIWQRLQPQMALTLARKVGRAWHRTTQGRPDSCRARHYGRRATSRPRRKRGRSPSRTHLPLAEKCMTAFGRKVQLDRRGARWRSCFGNRRSTTPTRETVASQRMGTWPRTTPICTSGSRKSAASAPHAPRSSVNFDSTTVRMQKETNAPIATRNLSHGPRTSTALLVLDGRHNSHGCNQPGPRSRHNSAFMLADSLSLVAILTLSSCSHASLSTHDTSRRAFSRISEVQDSNSCTCVNGCPATTKNFAACPASGLVLSTCAILDMVWNSLGAANIGTTNFSRSSGHETASSNSERARGLRRLLQRMLEVQSIICRANSHRGLVVRGSLQEENRRQVAPQRDWMQWRKALDKIDARVAQAIHVLHEGFTVHVKDDGEKLVGHRGLAILSLHSFVTNARWVVDETCRLGSCARVVPIEVLWLNMRVEHPIRRSLSPPEWTWTWLLTIGHCRSLVYA